MSCDWLSRQLGNLSGLKETGYFGIGRVLRRTAVQYRTTGYCTADWIEPELAVYGVRSRVPTEP
jgi:hypothetical protein